MNKWLIGLGLGACVVAGAIYVSVMQQPTQADPVAAPVVRLSIVNTPVMSGLIQDLAKDFEADNNIRVDISQTSDVADAARDGTADIIIAHYGKAGIKDLVLDGFGAWPEPVFANQLVLVGPASDPASVRSATDLADAFQRIAKTGSPFVNNEIPGVTYLTEILRRTAPDQQAAPQNVIQGYAKGRAMRQAQKQDGYSIWGAYPFFRFKRKHDSTLEVLHTTDPLLQRMMAAVVVQQAKLSPDTPNTAAQSAAEKFQAYLVSTRAQARIAKFRSPDIAYQLWWPRGRDGSPDGE